MWTQKVRFVHLDHLFLMLEAICPSQGVPFFLFTICHYFICNLLDLVSLKSLLLLPFYLNSNQFFVSLDTLDGKRQTQKKAANRTWFNSIQVYHFIKMVLCVTKCITCCKNIKTPATCMLNVTAAKKPLTFVCVVCLFDSANASDLVYVYKFF